MLFIRCLFKNIINTKTSMKVIIRIDHVAICFVSIDWIFSPTLIKIIFLYFILSLLGFFMKLKINLGFLQSITIGFLLIASIASVLFRAFLKQKHTCISSIQVYLQFSLLIWSRCIPTYPNSRPSQR